jgi:hypothetical protein
MATTQRTLDDPPEHVAAVLRERIYGGIACLSTLLVLVRHVETVTTPWGAFADVAVATGSLWAASLFADHVAHLAAYGHRPRGREAAQALRASAQILQASFVPLLLLVLAARGVLRLPGALRAGIWVSIVQLGLFALLAARRTNLPWWQRILIVAVLMVLGGLVVLVKTLAH